jgi:hypothetical protein
LADISLTAEKIDKPAKLRIFRRFIPEKAGGVPPLPRAVWTKDYRDNVAGTSR